MDKKTILERFELAQRLYSKGYEAVASTVLLGTLEEAARVKATASTRPSEDDELMAVAASLEERGFEDLAEEIRQLALAENEDAEGDEEDEDIDLDLGDEEDEDEDELAGEDMDEEEDAEEDEEEVGDEEDEEEDIDLDDLLTEEEDEEEAGDEEEEEADDLDLGDEEDEEEGEEEEEAPSEEVKAAVRKRLTAIANRLASYNDPVLRKHARRIRAQVEHI